MTRTKSALFAVSLISAGLLAMPAFAQSAMAQEAMLGWETGQQGNIAYASGGVGLEGRESLRQMEQSYNLRLMFAEQGTGHYLGEVRLRLMDGRGAPVVDTVLDGPYFLGRVPPGRYTVVADSNGIEMTRALSVPPAGAVESSFYWPPGQ